MKEERFYMSNRVRKRNLVSYWNYKFWSFVDWGDRKTGLVRSECLVSYIQDIKKFLKKLETG